MVVGVSPNQWSSLVAVTACEESVANLARELDLDLSQEGARYAAREQLVELFKPWFAARRSDDVHAALEAAGVCWGPYQTVKQLIAGDEEASPANPLFRKIDQPGIGELLTPSQPLKFSALPDIDPVPAPLLGQHTDEILAELLGLSSAEIGALHDGGVVAAPV